MKSSNLDFIFLQIPDITLYLIADNYGGMNGYTEGLFFFKKTTLWVGYLIYFKFTPVFFLWVFLRDIL